jgi:hypothetical protein
MDPSQLPDAGSSLSFSGAFIVRADHVSGRRTAAASLALNNNGPSGSMTLNFNDATIRVRFTSTDVITYNVRPADAGWRVDFTVVGDNAGAAGYILTGYAIDGGPAGAGADVLSLTVRTPTGELVVFSGTGVVSEGDVVIVR